jgi:plastocyanin
MQKKTIIEIAVVVVALAVMAGVVYVGVQKGGIRVGGPGEGEEKSPGESVAPGTSPISDRGEVLTAGGEPVDLGVTPGSPDAPQQSDPVSLGNLSGDVVKISASSVGFVPSEFEAKSGDAVTVAVTSTDSLTHLFKFSDPSLSAVAIGVGPGETRAISFNAPKSGEYAFLCDVPGHGSEVGKMVVK